MSAINTMQRRASCSALDTSQWRNDLEKGNTPSLPDAQAASACSRPPSLFKRIILKIWAAVKWLFKFIVGCALFITNPSFFTVAFTASLLFFSTQVRRAIDKVKMVWKKQAWSVLVLVAVGAFLALPITLATASFLYGGNLGAELAEVAEG